METEKLYSPLNFYLREHDGGRYGEYDENEYWRDEIGHEEAWGYLDAIDLFMRRDREQTMDARRGLAEYLDESLDSKIVSLFPVIELYGDKLWCVADMTLSESLTSEEMAAFKDWWSGQLSDGYGEGLEQREIRVNAGVLYIEPWTPDDHFFIDTKRELDERLGIDIPAVPRPAPESEVHEPLIRQREDGTTSVMDTLRRARENPSKRSPEPKQPGQPGQPKRKKTDPDR
jgi:hypothetical protein